MVLPKANQKALKEWAIAVDALIAGKTIMLLRKGGIKEKKFKVEYPNIWLYPTYEHQKPGLLKPEYAKSVVWVESGWHPQTVEIKGCAEITDVLPIERENQIEALLPYQIWNEKMISERLKWKSQQPLMVLLLRVYRLPQPKVISYSDTYGGCKSWMDLVEPIPNDGLDSVISKDKYDQMVQQIKNLV